MILGASAVAQMIQAIACLMLGVLGGALWLFLDKVPMIKILRIFSDIVLCLSLTVAFIACIQRLNKGEILMFHPACVLFGFLAIWKLLPKLVPYLTPDLAPKLFVSKGKVKKFFLATLATVKSKLGKHHEIVSRFFNSLITKLAPLFKNLSRFRIRKKGSPHDSIPRNYTEFVDERKAAKHST